MKISEIILEKTKRIREYINEMKARKAVYLFELDSVRVDRHDIIDGQRALIGEIVKNGNTVVLTMNQLVDSYAFTDLVKHKKTYECVLSLFESGALRTSLYEGLRSPAQYMRQSVIKCSNNKFKFSSLPIKMPKECSKEEEKYEETKRDTLVRALENSDLSELKEFMNGNAEQHKKDEYSQLTMFVELMLKISMSEISNLAKKEIKGRIYTEFLGLIKKFAEKFRCENALWNDNISAVLSELTAIENKLDADIASAKKKNEEAGRIVADVKNKDYRSVWYEEISHSAPREVRFLTELIIDLSYNYSLEDSISTVCKHYDDSAFEESFSVDLECRIRKALNDFGEKARGFTRKPINFRKWISVMRVAEFNKRRKLKSGVYEESEKKDRIAWHILVFSKIITAMLLILFYVILFLGIENGISYLERLTLPWLETVTLNSRVLNVISVLIFGLLSSFLSKKSLMYPNAL